MESSDGSLYRIAAWAAACAVALAVIQALIEAVGVGILGLPVPNTAVGWLELMHDQRVFAATAFTSLQIPLFALLIPVFVAIERAFDGDRRSLARVFAVVGIVGVAVYLATHTATAMLDLSDRYAVAADDAARAEIGAAAAGVLALYQGPGLSQGTLLVLLAVGGLAALQWRSAAFSRADAAVGLIAATLGMVYFVAVFLPDTRIYILELAGTVFVIWLAMLSRRLFRLSR